jgi:hypothetical protein
VVGKPVNYWHAFFYDGTKMHDLGLTSDSYFPSPPVDINNHDQVVGGDYIWTAATGRVSLADLIVDKPFGFRLIHASGINDAGQIVGTAAGPSHNYHAVVLTPVPEPNTLILLVGLAFSASVIVRQSANR